MFSKNFPVKLDKAIGFKEITLEELLSYGEAAYWVCDSEDGKWQYYFVQFSAVKELNVKIKKQVVIAYLDGKKDDGVKDK